MYVNMYIMGSDIFDVWKKLIISFFKYIFLISVWLFFNNFFFNRGILCMIVFLLKSYSCLNLKLNLI